MNRTIGKNNKSGAVGVYWNKSGKAWAAQIKRYNKTYYLGLFKNKNDAIKARIKAENNLNLFLDIR